MIAEEFVAKLQVILYDEYRKLGFTLFRLEAIHDTLTRTTYLRGEILCPCGGLEYFTYSVDIRNLKYPMRIPEYIRTTAHRILQGTASKEHITKDVADGTLPKSALEGNVYSGSLGDRRGN